MSLSREKSAPDLGRLSNTTLGELASFSSGKSIEPGGTGKFPVYGSNGPIGKTDEPIHENTIVIGRVGAFCGSVVLAEGLSWASDNTIVCTPTEEGLGELHYLYYLLKTLNLRHYAGGSAQPLLTQNVLKPLEVSILGANERKRVAQVLKSFDDLVENNQRRIEVLEETARLLYREWFVHFRYPGHEDMPLVDSELGQIPQGWEVVRLGDLAEFHTGNSKLTKKSYVSSGRFVAFSGSGPDGRVDLPEVSGQAVVVAAVGAYCGRTWLAKGDWTAIANTFWFRSMSDLATTDYLYWATRGRDGWMKRGAAQPFIAQQDARERRLCLPPLHQQKLFGDSIQPGLELGDQLQQQSVLLSDARDLLLPRLVSGDLDVSDLELDLEAVG